MFHQQFVFYPVGGGAFESTEHKFLRNNML